MHATVEFLETKIFPYVQNDGGINHKDAYNSIKRYYCGPMTAYDFCPRNCSMCTYTLRYALNCNKSTNPGGLLVWKLKDKVSRVLDAAMYEKETRAANIQPAINVNDQDLFGALIDQINQEIQRSGA